MTYTDCITIGLNLYRFHLLSHCHYHHNQHEQIVISQLNHKIMMLRDTKVMKIGSMHRQVVPEKHFPRKM